MGADHGQRVDKSGSGELLKAERIDLMTMDNPQNSDKDFEKIVAICQRVLRLTTGVFLAAFILIIAMTTLSTGPYVRMAAKGLYFLILVSALVSLGVWLYRNKTEKRWRISSRIG